MRRAAVTGARGLIGRHIAKYLLEEGWHVRTLSRSKNGVILHPNLQSFVGDIKNNETLEELIDGVDAIFHCAAELHDEVKMFDVNVNGTATLLKVVKQTPTIKYFCHLSSAGVIGPTTRLRVDEDSLCAPNNMYEKTKHEAEKLVFNAGLDMSVCVLRPANVFDMNKPGLLSYALNDSVMNKLSVFLKGNEGAHLVHAKDVAAAAIFFIDKKLVKPEAFFLSYDSDERNTVLGVYKLCCAQRAEGKVNTLWSLPSFIPYMIRRVRKGVSLHGHTRFSGKKLADAGFVFPMGLEASIVDVCRIDKANKS
ncbi:MAG: hypothetical protein COC22_00465 [Flavobacteriaceae bacterium]|nr:MAG: hypothetical protein COC22_00465 [Flavobacteriaceae bacterium]